ncbi:hypothetical protein B0H11DRAFT_859117 [Mycena galericulata]|nr:hypothetical protein B0H11DRAFT_859117 [Mycena galericulata]
MASSTPFDPLRPSHHLPFPNGRVYPTVALTCGHEYDANDDTWDRHTRVTPQFLPSPPPVALPPPTQTRKSTGCREAVHSGATMHWRPHTPQPEAWRAPATGTSSNVIPLEEKYFDPGVARALGLGALGACGCVLEGVGCRVCGNALGVRLTPCTVHGNAVYRYSFLPGNVSPPLPLDAGGAHRTTFIEHEQRLFDISDADSFPTPTAIFTPPPPAPERERGGETHLLVGRHARDVLHAYASATARDPERSPERLAGGYVYVAAPAPDDEYDRPGSQYHVERRPQQQQQRQELRALAPPTYEAEQEQEEVFMREIMEAESRVGAASHGHGHARMPLPRASYTGRGVLYGGVPDTDTGTAYTHAYGEPARVVRVPVRVVREGEGMETTQAGELLDSELATAAGRAVRRRWR